VFYGFEGKLKDASFWGERRGTYYCFDSKEERDKWVNNFPSGRIPVSASDRDIRWIKKTNPGYFSLYKVQA